MKFISQLNVVELASVLAGPLVGNFFSEAGARVVKIEKPHGGDITRSWKGAGENINAPVSAYYAAANYNKQVIELDLNNQSDRQRLFSELANADILLSNFKYGDEVRYGLVPEELSKMFPELIQGIIEGFPENPERTAFDIVLQAETGYLSMTGTDPLNLAKIPVALIDELAAHQLKEGLLLALMNRIETKKGSIVKVALYDSALAALVNQGSAYLMNDVVPVPSGTLHPSIAPYGEILICSDGARLVLAAGNNAQFNALCRCLGKEDLSTNELYQNNQLRVKNRDSLIMELNKLAKVHNGHDLYLALIEQKVPVGRIRSLKEVFESDAAKNLILNETIDGIETKRVSGNVFRIKQNP